MAKNENNSSKLPKNLSPANPIEDEILELRKKINDITNQLSDKNASVAKLKPKQDEYFKRLNELEKQLITSQSPIC